MPLLQDILNFRVLSPHFRPLILHEPPFSLPNYKGFYLLWKQRHHLGEFGLFFCMYFHEYISIITNNHLYFWCISCLFMSYLFYLTHYIHFNSSFANYFWLFFSPHSEFPFLVWNWKVGKMQFWFDEEGGYWLLFDVWGFYICRTNFANFIFF